MNSDVVYANVAEVWVLFCILYWGLYWGLYFNFQDSKTSKTSPVQNALINDHLEEFYFE